MPDETTVPNAEPEEAPAPPPRQYDTPGELVPTNLTDLGRLAEITAKSGLYGANETPRSSAVRIMLGMEIGMTPMQALSNIFIVDGKPSLGAHGIAMMIKRSPKYDYRVLERTDEACRIEYREKVDGTWEMVGRSSFTIDQAKRASLTGKNNWKAYPEDMLYARAMARGARTFCPDALGGAMHDPDELERTPQQVAPATTRRSLSPRADTPTETIVDADVGAEPPAEPETPETAAGAVEAKPAPPGSAENPHPEPVPLGTGKAKAKKKAATPEPEPLPEPTPEPEGEVVPESETEVEQPADEPADDDLGYGNDDNEGSVERDPARVEPTPDRLMPDQATQEADVEILKALLQSFDKPSLELILKGAGRPSGWKFADYARWLYEQNDQDREKTFAMIDERLAPVADDA